MPQWYEPNQTLYWEHRGQTADRYGKWKAIRPKPNADWELYDLEADLSETTSVAGEHPEILKQMQAFAAASHEPVRPGTYSDPQQRLHQKDRRAKWGTARRRR